MRPLLQRVGWVADKALSVVIWLHDSVMLFVCLFCLLPSIVLVVISAFIYDLRPVLRDCKRFSSIPFWGFRFGSAFVSTRSSQEHRQPVASVI